MATTPTPEAGIITTATVCQLLMLSRQRLDQLEKEGWIKRHAPGKWRTVDTVQGYIRFLRDADRRSVKSAADNRVRDARASGIELKNAREKRDLITIEESREALAIVCGAVRTEFGSLASRCTRDPVLRRKIDLEVNGCLTRICIVLDAQSKRLRDGDGKGRTVADPAAAGVVSPLG
jgi:phage terminase Nu1 subunit (DNA packaging protein)